MSRSGELAAAINAHLVRLEADTEYNAAKDRGGMSLRELCAAGAWASAGSVYVRYVDFQGNHRLSLAEAERYLAWLDVGNKGRHREALR